jgi:hypothetical protein
MRVLAGCEHACDVTGRVFGVMKQVSWPHVGQPFPGRRR